MIPRDIDFSTKQESNSNNNGDDTKTTPTTTTSWSRLQDPRIVRVSRALGGKDRHSKVCTVRGLRDRRVRLSVPTAIQLYDLQERLGLNQPSKVVDWLLDAAKHEIDELPPLQIPQGIMMLNSHHHFSSDHTKQGSAAGKTIKDDDDDHHHHHHQSWAARNNGHGEEEREDEEERNLEVETTNFQQNPSSFTSLMSSSSSSSSSFGRWDPSSLSLSSHAHHDQDLQSFNAVYQSAGMIPQPYFAPQIAPTNAAFHHHHHHHHHPTARPMFNFNMAVDRRDDQSKRHDLHSS